MSESSQRLDADVDNILSSLKKSGAKILMLGESHLTGNPIHTLWEKLIESIPEPDKWVLAVEQWQTHQDDFDKFQSGQIDLSELRKRYLFRYVAEGGEPRKKSRPFFRMLETAHKRGMKLVAADCAFENRESAQRETDMYACLAGHYGNGKNVVYCCGSLHAGGRQSGKRDCITCAELLMDNGIEIYASIEI